MEAIRRLETAAMTTPFSTEHTIEITEHMTQLGEVTAIVKALRDSLVRTHKAQHLQNVTPPRE
jgi:hypothetical protein